MLLRYSLLDPGQRAMRANDGLTRDMSEAPRDETIETFMREAADPKFLSLLSPEVIYEILDITADLNNLGQDALQFALEQLQNLKSSTLNSVSDHRPDHSSGDGTVVPRPASEGAYSVANAGSDYHIDLEQLPQLSFRPDDRR